MNKVVSFTKLRFLMFLVSILVIVAGMVGTILHGGFNLGIDFVGGFSQQIQLAPVAFSINYTGTGTVNAAIQKGVLTLDILESGRKENHRFLFSDYDNVSKLTGEINAIEGINVANNISYSSTAPARLLNTNYEVLLKQEGSVNVNIGLAGDNEVFARKADVVAALNEFGRLSVQMLGEEKEQKFIIKIHNEDAKYFLLSEDGPSVAAESSELVTDTGVVDAEAEIELTDEQRINRTEQARIESRITELLSKSFEKDAIIFQKNDYIGSTFSNEIAQGAIWSLILALLLILVYISVRFKFNYAVAALSALVHDVVVMIGVIGLLQLEVTTTTFAAVLTIVGYSLNDTIVVFDRVRENFNLIRDASRESIIDTSITQSLSRTIITSLTTLLAVVSIYVFGTGVIKDFAFNLIIGIVVGTYSSIFIASPIVLSWMNVQDKRKKEKQDLKLGKMKPVVPKPPVIKAVDGETAENIENSDSGEASGQRIQRKKKKKKKK